MLNLSTLMMVLNAASLLVSVITMVYVIVLMKKFKAQSRRDGNMAGLGQASSAKEEKPSLETGVVFCRTCGNQYDSSLKVCPNCKTKR